MLEIPLKNKAELDIVAQTCFHFATTPKHPHLKVNYKARVLWYTTTPGKHIETVNAAIIYIKAFRNERKKIIDDLTMAFIHKHRLFRQYERPSDSPPPQEIDMEKELRIMSIAKGLDNVEIHKQIGDGSK